MSKPGYVYIIQMGNSNNYKIGKSYDSFNRSKQLQTGNPSRLLVLNAFYCKDVDKLEKIIHMNYNKYILIGEWFTFNSTVLSECITFILKTIAEIHESANSENNEIATETNSICKQSKNTEFATSLENHKINNKTVKKYKKYKCLNCKKMYSSASSLTVHKKNHCKITKEKEKASEIMKLGMQIREELNKLPPDDFLSRARLFKLLGSL